MSPNRFDDFTEAQAAALAKAIDRLWFRTLQVIITLVIGIAIGYGWGLYQIQNSSQRSDEAAHRVDEVTREIARQAQANAKASAKSSYAVCRQLQEGRLAIRRLIHITIPEHDPTRTPSEQDQIDSYYSELAARHVLDVPTCQKPPKGD